MKRALVLTFALLYVLRGAAEPAPTRPELRFRDLYDREITLQHDLGIPVLVLFFFSDTCPVARRYMPRINQLAAEYGPRGVRFIGVNASPADSLQEIAEFAQEFNIPYPVLKDVSFDAVKTLEITRTPEVAVLDQNFVKVYKGRIDDQYRLGGVRPSATRHDLAEALDALLAGRAAPASHVPAEGCAITYPDGANSPLATEDVWSEPVREFSHEFRLKGAGVPGDIPGTLEWELAPPIAEEAWVNAIEVRGPSHGVSLFYQDSAIPDKRHYVVGALDSGQPTQWSEDEGMRLPGGTKLGISLPDGAGTDLSVHINLRGTPPVREIFCSRGLHRITRNQPDAPRLIQSVPEGAALERVAVAFTDYGASIVLDSVRPDQTSETLLTLPILDPSKPATFRMTDAPARTGAVVSVRATLHFPGYLRSPLSESLEPVDDASLSMFLYWSLSE